MGEPLNTETKSTRIEKQKQRTATCTIQKNSVHSFLGEQMVECATHGKPMFPPGTPNWTGACLIGAMDDGWVVRKKIPWFKANGLPDSADDRFGTSHEMVFHCVKNNEPAFWTHPDSLGVTVKPKQDPYWRNQRTGHTTESPPAGWTREQPVAADGDRWTKLNRWEGHDYFFDGDAIRVPLEDERGPGRKSRAFNLRVQRASTGRDEAAGFTGVSAKAWEFEVHGRDGVRLLPSGANGASGSRNGKYDWDEVGVEHAARLGQFRDTQRAAKYATGLSQGDVQRAIREAGDSHLKNAAALASYRDAGHLGNPVGKNPGDVWFINTRPFDEGHYATFPVGLCLRPIRATCPERVCVECGTPWMRRSVVELQSSRPGAASTVARRDQVRLEDPSRGQVVSRVASGYNVVRRGPLVKGCRCRAAWKPGVVLDPFGGSGTVGVVAADEGRSFILVDVSPKYARIAQKRLAERLRPVTAFDEKNWRANRVEVASAAEAA